MTRRRILIPPDSQLFERLRERGPGAPSLPEKLEMLRSARGQSEEFDQSLDEYLLVLSDRASANPTPTQPANSNGSNGALSPDSL